MPLVLNYFTGQCDESPQSSIDQIMEILFHIWLLWNVLFLGARMISDDMQKKLNTGPFYRWHGPMVNVLLFLFTGNGWWKWLGGILLLIGLYIFSSEVRGRHTFELKNMKMLILINCHHMGPVIAWYFQAPEHSWINALFFGHVWWIHSKPIFNDYAKTWVTKFCDKVLGIDIEDRHCEHGYSVVTVLGTAYFLDFAASGGHTYMYAAAFSQYFGRWFINNNFHGVDWMKAIETPGVLAVLTWQIGAPTTIFVHIVWLFFSYKMGRIIDGPEQVPEKIVVTKALKQWMSDFKWEALTEDIVKAKIAWWDENCAEWDEKYNILKHCMLGEVDKIKECIANGVDPELKCTVWYDSNPTQWAAASGQIGAMIALIEAGVNIYKTKCRASANQFSQKRVIKFMDELIPEAIKANQSASNIHYFRQEKCMNFADHEKFVKEKGGELASVKEIQEFLCGHAIIGGDDQWVACMNSKGERDWVQVGDQHHPAGRSHREQGWGYPVWGDDMTNDTFGKIKWTAVTVWKSLDGVAA